MVHHVIIGAGPAGVIAAETLRKEDPDSKITIIGEETEPPYSRMAIPYLLIKKVGEEGTYLRKNPQHFAERRINLMQQRVKRINTHDNFVVLDNATTHHFDTLLIATGSSPVLPPVAGINSKGVHNCWTLNDARNIIKIAQHGAKVVLLGAGFVGCIVLEALAMRGVDLTVVEMGDRMVPRMMPPKAGNLIKTWCQSKGVQVCTSTRVVSIERDDKRPHPLAVSLSDGRVLEADLVISAAGVRPNTQFLQGSGIQTHKGNGILVDHYLQTNIPSIFAAGDVAEGRDFSTWNFEVHAIQPTAAEHGRIAALNMTGHRHFYRGSFNMNVLDTLGLISASFGLWMGVDGGDNVELYDPERYRYIKLEFKEDFLVGATSLGVTQHIGVLRGLIHGRVPLGSWKERLKADPFRLMEAYLARTQIPESSGWRPEDTRRAALLEV
ncbi:NAD(P)H-nitrite reductase [Beggiatoa alba B18LD]|uniref:NAD(P)H-nitrite reductase n=1 Tax=Beggiatoa alba B18LD TaxID=395493 RepID=I3CKT4_9GAMM|nr:FAD-dependent oxidoreductase [Beggiatoa alba]EIJ44227.1 NAD(P)H-nitrite reductase [Beggiatoa alba B18LD]